MIQNRRSPNGALLLAGLAAFAYYKYNKMSEDEKRNLVGTLKEKGQKLYDQYVPEDIKSIFGTKSNTAAGNSKYGEGDSFTS
jgi:hypothetical protein